MIIHGVMLSSQRPVQTRESQDILQQYHQKAAYTSVHELEFSLCNKKAEVDYTFNSVQTFKEK